MKLLPYFISPNDFTSNYSKCNYFSYNYLIIITLIDITSHEISPLLFTFIDTNSDLEKAACGASGAWGHFVGNHAILRTFLVKYPVLLTEDGGRRVEDGDNGLDQGDLR